MKLAPFKVRGSSMYRAKACLGYVALESSIPTHDGDTEASLLGTFCHALGAEALAEDIHPQHMVGASLSAKTWRRVDFKEVETSHTFIVTKEMADSVSVYFEYAKYTEALLPPGKWFVEKRLTGRHELEDLTGTADLLGFFGDTLVVVDYKNGRVYVDVVDNLQLDCYFVLGMQELVEDHDFCVPKKLIQTIVQPNSYGREVKTRCKFNEKNNLVESAVRSLSTAINLSRAVYNDFKKTGKLDVSKFKIGGHCMFCGCVLECPRVASFISDAVEGKMDDNRILESFEALPVVRAWINAIQERSMTLACMNKLPGYRIEKTEGRQNRMWKNQEFAIKLLTDDDFFGVPLSQVVEMRSPSAIEKILPLKLKKRLKDLVFKAPGKETHKISKIGRDPFEGLYERDEEDE